MVESRTIVISQDYRLQKEQIKYEIVIRSRDSGFALAIGCAPMRLPEEVFRGCVFQKISRRRLMDPKKTALVLIEYQNDFTTPGGTLHDAVKGVMASTNMLANTIETV